jgi:hypothetical protein
MGIPWKRALHRRQGTVWVRVAVHPDVDTGNVMKNVLSSFMQRLGGLCI